MYRHLLVPIDDTDLSIEVVGNAVGLARAVGAHVTFFHAVVGVTDVLSVTSQGGPPHDSVGKAAELLAKAEAAARASGVPCDSKHVLSDRPAAAIAETAHDIGCDLVFMASHGHHHSEPGTAAGSETFGVVLNAGLPVLVHRVGVPGPPAHALGIIRDEHRSLAAVLHTWMHALKRARSGGSAADPRLMRAIVRYLEVFLSALHGPKEDHLFKRLRKRTSAVSAELDELQRQHARERQRLADLAARVDTLIAARGEAAVSAMRDLDDAVRGYAGFVWEYLGREEGVILPAAQRHLTKADWSAIDAAFVKRRDPGFGGEADKEAEQLFSHIVGAVHRA